MDRPELTGTDDARLVAAQLDAGLDDGGDRERVVVVVPQPVSGLDEQLEADPGMLATDRLHAQAVELPGGHRPHASRPALLAETLTAATRMRDTTRHG